MVRNGLYIFKYQATVTLTFGLSPPKLIRFWALVWVKCEIDYIFTYWAPVTLTSNIIRS